VSTEIAERDFDAALAAIGGVEGWLSTDQARRLWDAARRVQAPARIVEIGSFRGRSTIVLRLAAAEGVEVVAIDPHGGGDRGPQEITPDAVRGDDDYRTFHANLDQAGVDSLVRHVRRMSDDALGQVEGPIDVLYVDGAHRFGPAREDVVRWGERVRDGGTMLVHDSFASIGVTLATLTSITFGGRWRYVGRTGSLAEYRRTRLGGHDRASNTLRQLAQLPWFVRNVIVKIALVTGIRPLARLMGHHGDDWPY
jgi:predicted O-methyltransferase YrrM